MCNFASIPSIPSCSKLALFTFLLGCVFSGATAAEARASERYGELKLHFEANRGQAHEDVRFLSRGPGYSLFLTAGEAVLVLAGPNPPVVLRMAIINAAPHKLVSGLEELPGKANYFVGNDPAKWRTNVPTYAKVRYRDVYPGIDLLYYGNQRQLEYDFVVAAGADPERIVLGFQGADRLEIDAQGDLVLHAAGGVIRQRKPFIYQEIDGIRREIDGGYVRKSANQVSFQVAAYDASRPLVIDPILFYSTYLGASASDAGRAIAVDASGNAYVTGETLSADFPTSVGAFDSVFGGGAVFGDAFVTKLNSTGSALVYSTYLGGSGDDQGLGVAVDASGNAYVAGRTNSLDFPTTPGAFQTAFGGGADDAFVTKLDASGALLAYSSYLGGGAQDIGNGIAVDATGNAYVTGVTNSGLSGTTSFPTTPGAVHPAYLGGTSDAFVTKLNATGSALAYSTYLGGALSDFGFGVAVDASGNAYVTGQTNSDGVATAGAFQPTFGGIIDAFATKLNPAGSTLVYSTYLGGSGADAGFAIAVDTLGNAYVTGQTESANFPTTPGAFDTTLGGSLDAFATKVNPAGSGLAYSTYLGGSSNDAGTGIAVDASFNAYLSGATLSADFPTVNAVQAAPGGSSDAFATKVNPTGSSLVYSTFLGGSGFDQGTGIALDALPSPNAYVTGLTASTDFPTTTGAFDTTFNGVSDAFVAKIVDVVLPPQPTVGKVTGGGSINVAGGTGAFGFVVQRQAVDASVDGHLQYVNHATKAKVKSVMFTMFEVTGNKATFSGTCTNNGASCTFTVEVMDDGEPGVDDTFTISVSAGPTEGGMLRSGNIQIHQ